jgi:aminopeptidase N
MNKYYRLLLVVTGLLSVEFSGAQQADSKKLPVPHWTRPRKLDVKHIALDLQFDWKNRQAYGTAAITLAPLDVTSSISLDAGMLTINSITVNGSIVKFTYDGGDQNDGLHITLDRNYLAGESLTLLIDYHTNHVNETDPVSLGGSNGKGGLRFIWPTPAEPARKKQIWSLGDPESNRYWFPGYDYPNDFHTSEFTATVEEYLTVVANGQLIETTYNPDGSKTFHYRTDLPQANQNTSFVIGEYKDIPQHYNHVELHNYSYPNEVAATTASVERLPDMMKFFSEYTGVEYPYQSYSQAFVQDIPWGSVGTGIAAQSENMVDDYDTHADYLYLWDCLEGESLAWQWTGSYVTPSDWTHTWLSKGLSRYLSGLYSAHKNGIDEFLIWQHTYDQWVYGTDWASGIREPIVTKNYESVGGNTPYFYGASVMRMLHKQMGDEKWKKALNYYLKNNANKPVTTEDFRKAIEEASGDPMDWFFDQWVYHVGHPVFEVSKQYDATRKQLIIAVKQTQTPDSAQLHPQTEYFQGKIEIEIDKKIETVWIEPKTENVFIFSAAEEPKLINFDYQSTWLKELTFTKTIDELIHLVQNSTDGTARQSGINDLTARMKDAAANQHDKIKVINALQGIVQSNAYWRIRMNSLSQLRNLLTTTNQPMKLDAATRNVLLDVIAKDKSWVKATSIGFLGTTLDPKYADVYIKAMTDKSDRVVNTAAIALGKSKSPKAYASLAKLVSRPSWKNQSLMSALAGLQQLGDPRAYDIAYRYLADVREPRWNLPQVSTGLWDYRVFAAQTIAMLGRSAEAYPLILERLKKSLKEDDLNVIFNNVLLIETLAYPKGEEIFSLLRTKFKNNESLLAVVSQYEVQFKEATKQFSIGSK